MGQGTCADAYLEAVDKAEQQCLFHRVSPSRLREGRAGCQGRSKEVSVNNTCLAGPGVGRVRAALGGAGVGEPSAAPYYLTVR